MFDDLRQSIKKMRGDFSNNEHTSIAVGRDVVRKNLWVIYLGLGSLLIIGALQFREALLFLAYGGAPFVFDSTLFLESIPLLSRILPRVTVIIELGMEFGAVSVGISLGIVYAIYRLIGVVRMGVPYYWSLKNKDE